VVALHQLERAPDRRVRRQRDRLDDHPRLGALDLVHLRDLVGDRQVAVHDSDSSLARDRDREARLGDRVHRGRDDRDRELDPRRQPRRDRDVVREDMRLGRPEEDVVESEPLLAELVLERPEALDLDVIGLGGSRLDVHGTA
jgi:hypothetical protein